MPTKFSCSLSFHTLEPCARRGEPVSVGLPWPRGAIADEKYFQLIGPDGSQQVLQTKVLDRWPDGSVRWCLFDFLATWDGKTREGGYRVEVGEEANPLRGFGKSRCPEKVFDLITDETEQPVSLGEVIDSGSVRQRRMMNLKPITGYEQFGHIDEFSSTPTIRVQLTIRNPNVAEHPGGNWDLGNGGSIYLHHLSIRAKLTTPVLYFSVGRNEPLQTCSSFYLNQASSGGENWNSTNHFDDEHEINLDFSGFQMRVDKQSETGKRATPILFSESIGMTTPHYWQNFPKQIEAHDGEMRLSLLPLQKRTYELQGGEQKTHTFYVAFGKDTITDEPMVWCRSPITAHASPEWYAASGAIEYLTPKASDPHAKYLALVDQAIDGPDTFLTKRETIDEYGWRNFGDIYGDHEAVGWAGKSPMISHYNNQYDCVAAFLIQFFRSGDLRWLSQGIECADHTCDIDIYHTDGDKAAYNRGLFWHTYHYADADTGTHRSYPKSLKHSHVESLTKKMDELGETAKMLKKSYAVGGGPASSHNYNAGLMLSYFLTGNMLYRDTAIDLANFVINMEDPAKTPFRYLSREYTGLATESGGGGYHGPGRAAANSILALIVGHQLTGENRYLEKAEQLIRRVVHPKQNLERLDLLNAELRWFYTMTLQALGRYLDYKIELGQLDHMYGYARNSLLHYARWMATNERPILDTPEKLQYPNETWAAQDMRKVEVFQYAAKHANGAEKAKYLERAEWFFDYVQNTLSEFETKSLCRPVILIMKYGWSRNWWRENPMATAPETDTAVSAGEFGEWSMFVPQKTMAMKRAKRLLVAGVAFVFVAFCATVLWFMV